MVAHSWRSCFWSDCERATRCDLQLVKRTPFLHAMIRSFDGDYQPLAEQLDALRA